MKRQKFLTKKRSHTNKHAIALKKLGEPITREVHSEKVTVYWGGGRRWFSKKQAAKAEAKRLLQEKCDCWTERSYHFYGERHSELCRYHGMDTLEWKRVRDRLAQRILYYWRTGHASEKEANGEAKEGFAFEAPRKSQPEPGSSIGSRPPDAGL